jgi:hypothetical protein
MAIEAIDLARLAKIGLMWTLHEQGVDVSDVVMLTGFSWDNGGVYISGNEWVAVSAEYVARAAAGEKLEFPDGVWTPPAAPKAEAPRTEAPVSTSPPGKWEAPLGEARAAAASYDAMGFRVEFNPGDLNSDTLPLIFKDPRWGVTGELPINATEHGFFSAVVNHRYGEEDVAVAMLVGFADETGKYRLIRMYDQSGYGSHIIPAGGGKGVPRRDPVPGKNVWGKDLATLAMAALADRLTSQGIDFTISGKGVLEFTLPGDPSQISGVWTIPGD